MSIEALREALEDKIQDEFGNGAVIRWKSAGRYDYAAIKTPVGWYTTAKTGNTYVPQIVSFSDLVEILKSPEVSDVEASIMWEIIK